MNLPLSDLFGADQRLQRVRPGRDKVLAGVRAPAMDAALAVVAAPSRKERWGW